VVAVASVDVRIATAVWRVSPELVLALDEHLGPPVDSYVNGSQTWFTGEPVLEWRLHPAAGFRRPGDISPYDLWDAVVGALAAGGDPAQLPIAPDLSGLVDHDTIGDEWERGDCAVSIVALLVGQLSG
jgi:hypothetical protein